jgi:aminopeptidase N
LDILQLSTADITFGGAFIVLLILAFQAMAQSRKSRENESKANAERDVASDKLQEKLIGILEAQFSLQSIFVEDQKAFREALIGMSSSVKEQVEAVSEANKRSAEIISMVEGIEKKLNKITEAVNHLSDETRLKKMEAMLDRVILAVESAPKKDVFEEAKGE